MNTFYHILAEQVHFWIRRPVYYLFLLGGFLASWGLLVGTAGLFDPSPGLPPARPWLNSPVSIFRMAAFFHPFLLAVTAVIAGQTGTRDFLYRTHLLIFSTPVSRFTYLLGRWLGSVTLLLAIAVMLLAGLWLGEHTPGIAAQQLGPIRPQAYLHTWLLFLFPNLIIWSALIFMASLHSRSTYAAYILAIALWLLRFLLPAFSAVTPLLSVIGDPFGEYAQEYLIRYWTVEQQQTQRLPYGQVVCWNRLLCLCLAAGVFTLGGYRFHFTRMASPGGWGHKFILHTKRLENLQPLRVQYSRLMERLPDIPFSTQALSSFRFSTVWWLAMFQLRYLIRQPVIHLLSGLALLSFILVGQRILQGTPLIFQVDTHLLLAAPAALFSQVILLLTFLISGMLVHRDRRSRIQELTQLNTLAGWQPIAAQIGVVLLVQAVLLAVLVGIVIGWQALYGEKSPDIFIPFIYAYSVIWPWLIVWGLAAMAVHQLTGQLYTGLLVLLLGWVGMNLLPAVGFTDTILLFPGSAQLTLSRFQSWSRQLLPFLYIKGYWLSLTMFYLIIASLLRARHTGSGFTERWAFAKNRIRPEIISLLLAFALLWVTWGYAIHRQEQDRFHPPGPAARTAHLQSIQSFMDRPFPVIRDIDLSIDLYPAAQAYHIDGTYRLENPHDQPIDTILLRGGFDEQTSFSWPVPARKIFCDSLFQTEVWVLESPLMPAEQIALHFAVHSRPATYFDHPQHVEYEGIYLRQDVLPRLGYPILDSLPAHLRRNYLSADADLVHLTTTICAPATLQTLAPGTRTNTHQQEDRHCTTFTTPHPIKFSFGFLAGNYVRSTEYWGSLPLHIWHHPAHSATAPILTAGLRAALQYHSRYFPPYPFADASVVEFPGTLGSHATAYANLLPVSERNFLIRPDTTQASIALPFYLTAHELTHQWWGNQVIPAAEPGALMLTESITEYLSGQIYRQQFGDEAMAAFMRLQHERYFRGRTAETGTEPPLSQVTDGQSYLAYGKGSLVLLALAGQVGEERLNYLLSDFLRKHKPPNYPQANDLVQMLTDSLPDKYAPFLHDRLQTVTLHHLAWQDARVTRKANGTWQISMLPKVRAERMVQGQWQDIPFAEAIPIVCYNQAGQVLEQLTLYPDLIGDTLSIELSEAPSHLEIDPNLYFLDPDLTDQVIYLRE